MWYCVPNYSMKCRIYPNKEQQKIIDNILYGIRVAYNVTMYEMITNLKNTKEATDKKIKKRLFISLFLGTWLKKIGLTIFVTIILLLKKFLLAALVLPSMEFLLAMLKKHGSL